MAPRGMVPVVPEWCDCTDLSNPKKAASFIGICRAVLALGSLILCIVFIASPKSLLYHDRSISSDSLSTIRGIIIFICLLNVLHFFVGAYLVYLANTNRITSLRIVRRWVIVDMVISGIYVLFILILLFCIPGRFLYIILGVKLILLSLILCYRSWYVYYLFNEGWSHQGIAQVTVEGQPTNQPTYMNVYRI